MIVYTDSYLLSSLSNLLSDISNKSEEEILALIQLKNFLKSKDIKCVYILDKGKIAFPEEIRDYLRNPQSIPEPNSVKINCNNIDYSTPFTYFIFSKKVDDVLESKNKACYSVNNLKDFAKKITYELFKDVSKNPKSDLKYWENIEKFYPLLPTNTIIVCDNYLFKNKFKENIRGLLRTLLGKLNKSNLFDITLICGHEYDVSKLQIYWQDIFDYLKNELSINSPRLAIIKKQNKDFHDRHVYTDYQVFDSGNSYTMYFYASTSLHLFPYSMDNNNNQTKYNHYLSHLKSIKSIISSAKSEEIIGDPKNRLIDSI